MFENILEYLESYCWFGYGDCNYVKNADEPQLPLATSPLVIIDPNITDPSEESGWPFTLTLEGDGSSILDSTLFSNIVLAAFIGATTSCLVLYLGLRPFLPFAKPGQPKCDSCTSGANLPPSPQDSSTDATSPQEYPIKCLGDYSLLDFIGEPNLIKKTFEDSNQSSFPRHLRQLNVFSRFTRRLTNRKVEVENLPQPKAEVHLPAFVHANLLTPRPLQCSKQTQCSEADMLTSITTPRPGPPPSQGGQHVKSIATNTNSEPLVATKEAGTQKDDGSSDKGNFESDAPARKQLETPTLILHQYPRGNLIPCEQPMGMMFESFLRLVKLPYSVAFDCCTSAPQGGPRLSCRFVSDDSNDEKIELLEENSENLVEFLTNHFPISQPFLKNVQVNVKKKVPAHFILTLVQFHLIPVFHRWRVVQKISHYGNNEVDSGVTNPARFLEIESKTESNPFNYAIEQMTQSELELGVQLDLASLSASLDNKLYFIGDQISIVDCNVFAVLSQLIWDKSASALQRMIYRIPNLVRHTVNVKSLLWPDWESNLKLQPLFRRELASLFPTSPLQHVHYDNDSHDADNVEVTRRVGDGKPERDRDGVQKFENNGIWLSKNDFADENAQGWTTRIRIPVSRETLV